jgi:hypothetical protein
MKISIVEIHPPPNFQAAAPASNPLNGPSIENPPRDIETVNYCLRVFGKLSAKLT